MTIAVAPPRVLTMEEYRSNWQPKGWQLIVIGPTSTWRQDWGEWEAIRDLVQNCLDEAEAYRWGYDDRGLWISDRGRGVAVADFLLGPPKLKPDYARGKFGEGMKIAALALLRKGYSVYVSTVGRELWIVFLQQKVNGSAETLAALWRPNGINVGTKFHIIGYTGSAFKDRFAVNLPREAVLAEGPSPLTEPVRRYNQLLNEAYTDGPKIYARDIYMRDIKSIFSYNLWGFEMAPDRHAPREESQLWVEMGRLWCCVTSVKWLEMFFQMMRYPPAVETDESLNLNMSGWSMGYEPVTGKPYADFVGEQASAWKQAWRNNFGDDAVLRTADRWDNIVKHLGYNSVSLYYGVQDTVSRAIITDAELVKASADRLREVQVISDTRLTPEQFAHLNLARAVVNLITPYIVGTMPRAVHAAIIPPASDRVRTAGMYSRTTTEIYISLEQLAWGSKTIDTIIHELAHHTSGAEDLEERHSNHMTKIAGMVVHYTHRGEFDELMKEAVW